MLIAGPSAPATSYTEPAPAKTGYGSSTLRSPEPITLSATSPMSHVVAKGDTLYSPARRYYGDPSRWKDIYQANQQTLPGDNYTLYSLNKVVKFLMISVI